MSSADMSSAMSSNETMDSDDRQLRTSRRNKRKVPLRYSDSDSSGSFTNPRKNYEYIPEKDDTVVLWKDHIENCLTAFRRNIVGAENPFYTIKPDGLSIDMMLKIRKDSPIFHLPEGILQSLDYRAACHVLRRDLSTLQFDPENKHWEFKERLKEQTVAEVQAALGLSDKECTMYDGVRHRMTRQGVRILEGFIEGFKNSVGRKSLRRLLDYGTHLMYINSLEGTPELFLEATNVDGGSPRDGNAKIFETDFTEQGFRWPSGSPRKDALLKLRDMTKNNSCTFKTRVPDAQVILNESPEQMFIITGEVKPSLHKNLSELEDAIVQTWEQALVGLIRMDVTYGLLICQRAAWLLQIRLDHQAREIITSKEEFRFTSKETSTQHCYRYPFETESFLNLFKCIVGILYHHTPRS